MTAEDGKQPSVDTELYVGNRCMLRVAGDHFLVRILEVQKGYIRVSFPGKEYPIEGLQVLLEFHDERGFNSYRTNIVQGPEKAAGALVLARPADSRRTKYRDSCRIPTDLTVHVKDQVHPRRYDAALVNLGSGGALIVTQAQFEFGSTVEMQLSLPGELQHTVLGQIVHTTGSPHLQGGADTAYGIRFMSLEQEVAQSITRYVWQRLRDIYPSA